MWADRKGYAVLTGCRLNIPTLFPWWEDCFFP